jgi:EAL domain-containing protein (putative c-di-GMP-specific phosphodiesterase class I)
VAFDLDHLFMVYQPQIDLSTRKLTGLEALMRWRGKDGQMVPPDRFIPIAEQSGLVVALGDWALNVSCATMRHLCDLGIAPPRMAVNVSVEQFKSSDFVERVAKALQNAGLDGNQLELEITESVAVLGLQNMEAILIRLREMAVTIAIDDFGTGYSSLSYVERLPLDRLKIDKSFVRQLGEPNAPRIAEMIIELGQTLGARVLAEGIEDQANWTALQSMGCHEGQGFFIGKPMERTQLAEWIRNYGT